MVILSYSFHVLRSWTSLYKWHIECMWLARYVLYSEFMTTCIRATVVLLMECRQHVLYSTDNQLWSFIGLKWTSDASCASAHAWINRWLFDGWRHRARINRWPCLLAVTCPRYARLIHVLAWPPLSSRATLIMQWPQGARIFGVRRLWRS